VVISKETRTKIAALFPQYPKKRGALLAALHVIQDDLGHIAPETAVEVAEIFDLHPVEVMEVVSFYNMFYDAPQARHHVAVCTNLSCSLRGGRTLLRDLEAHLGVKSGEATSDGRVHLGHEECLGACGYAPMMRIDDRYHEDLDAEEAKRILDELE